MGILEKLARLEENLAILKEIEQEMQEGIIDKKQEWQIRYGFFESIHIVIDIACKLTSKYNFAKPKSYKECIEALVKAKIIDAKLGDDLVKMVGFRNILIHDYEEIEKDALISYLQRVEDFKKFIQAVKDL